MEKSKKSGKNPKNPKKKSKKSKKIQKSRKSEKIRKIQKKSEKIQSNFSFVHPNHEWTTPREISSGDVGTAVRSILMDNTNQGVRFD